MFILPSLHNFFGFGRKKNCKLLRIIYHILIKLYNILCVTKYKDLEKVVNSKNTLLW